MDLDNHGHEDDDQRVVLTIRRSDAALLVDGLQSLEYWDYATELDLPRRNGQVFLPEDDSSWWGVVETGSDAENAIKQIRNLRDLSAVIADQLGDV